MGDIAKQQEIFTGGCNFCQLETVLIRCIENIARSTFVISILLPSQNYSVFRHV